MRGLVTWLKQHLESVVFIAAVVFLLNLVIWWAVFARRVIRENESTATLLLNATVTDGAALANELSSLHQKSDRQLTMISSEAPFFGFLVFSGVGALFVLARARRSDHDRMEKLLQLTTHELKTPVAGVRALLQSLKIGSIPAEERDRFLDQGIGECDRLEHLAETILAYQRAVVRPDGQLPLKSDELIAEILDHRLRTFGAEGLQWQRGEAVSVWADKDAFRVVLENLLDNARKYGGGAVEIDDRRDGPTWRLQVKDRGQGFEPRLAESLFEPFSRHADAVTHGSGLGLYLSRQLTQQMGGELSAKSAGPGQGSTFVLELPCASDSPVSLPPSRSADA